MKKLTCILLVAMFTMTSMLFAQISGEIGGEVSEYFTITNKNTQESQRVYVNKFTSEGSNKSSYDVDFCLGIYTGDQIEITYSALFYLSKPKVVWSYSWNNSFSGDLESGLTTNLSVSGVPYNGSVLTVTGNILNSKGETSESYNIRFKNVHNVKRIEVIPNHASKEFLLSYAYYDELLSCTAQGALASLCTYPSGTLVTSRYFTSVADGVGWAVLSTGNKSGIYIVNVTVNNKIIFSDKRTIGN